jgi:hypothetical protein
MRPYNLPTEYIRAQSATDYVTWDSNGESSQRPFRLAGELRWAPHQDEGRCCSMVTQM